MLHAETTLLGRQINKQNGVHISWSKFGGMEPSSLPKLPGLLEKQKAWPICHVMLRWAVASNLANGC